jgi:glycine/D-amino acid oxidase-like deaminating enzyme
MRLTAVVIGGGAIGASCFHHLLERGVRDVLLVEQAGLGSGSTGRSAAVVETQYVSRDKIALCAYSMRLFRRLERECGLPFVHHGYLRLGHTGEDVRQFHRSVEMQREHGVADAVVLEPPELTRTVPDLHVEDLTSALFGPLTPDSQPILGEMPGLRGFYNAIGGGGVGVQISPAVGAIIADLVTTGETAVVPAIESYRLERFQPGAGP